MKTQETSHHCTIVGKTLDLTWNQMCLVIVVDLTTLGLFFKQMNNLVKPPKIHVAWSVSPKP